MVTFTEKLNDKTTLVKTVIKTITYNLGCVEEGFNHVYMATDFDNRTLKDKDNSVVFTDFNKARTAIILAWESEFGR